MHQVHQEDQVEMEMQGQLVGKVKRERKEMLVNKVLLVPLGLAVYQE